MKHASVLFAALALAALPALGQVQPIQVTYRVLDASVSPNITDNVGVLVLTLPASTDNATAKLEVTMLYRASCHSLGCVSSQTLSVTRTVNRTGSAEHWSSDPTPVLFAIPVTSVVSVFVNGYGRTGAQGISTPCDGTGLGVSCQDSSMVRRPRCVGVCQQLTPEEAAYLGEFEAAIRDIEERPEGELGRPARNAFSSVSNGAGLASRMATLLSSQGGREGLRVAVE
jgi:hypothetical protein